MAANSARSQPPLVVIVGPTASGKTGLAVRLARELGGEVISADSRAIYTGLTLGTAKPTPEEQQGVSHWGIDLVNPSERFTAADFKVYALEKIADIRMRGHIPILVGGTGLYINAVLYDFTFPAIEHDSDRRDELMGWSLEALHEYCIKNNILLPENSKNKRYVVNTILRNGQALKRKHMLDDNIIVVGISTDREILRKRIELRARNIVSPATIHEAEVAAEKYGWDNEAMTGNVYPLIRRYVHEEITQEDMLQQFITRDWRLAKRQLTWFRRDEHIKWFDIENAYRYIVQACQEVDHL